MGESQLTSPDNKRVKKDVYLSLETPQLPMAGPETEDMTVQCGRV
jgi:hypothetical protein